MNEEIVLSDGKENNQIIPTTNSGGKKAHLRTNSLGAINSGRFRRPPNKATTWFDESRIGRYVLVDASTNWCFVCGSVSRKVSEESFSTFHPLGKLFSIFTFPHFELYRKDKGSLNERIFEDPVVAEPSLRFRKSETLFIFWVKQESSREPASKPRKTLSLLGGSIRNFITQATFICLLHSKLKRPKGLQQYSTYV